MSFLDRFRKKQEQTATQDRQEYGRLIGKEADGRLTEKDDARLEALMQRLGVTPADLERHVGTVREVNAMLPRIEAGRKAKADLKAVEEEMARFNAQWAQIQQEWTAKGAELQVRFDAAYGSASTGEHTEGRLEELKEREPLAFGLEPKAPPTPMRLSDSEIAQMSRDADKQGQAESFREALGSNRPVVIRPEDLKLLEEAKEKGWISDDILKLARAKAPKAPEKPAPVKTDAEDMQDVLSHGAPALVK